MSSIFFQWTKEGTEEVKGQDTKDTKLLNATYDEMIDIIVLPQRRFVISIMAEGKKMSLP